MEASVLIFPNEHNDDNYLLTTFIYINTEGPTIKDDDFPID